MNLSNLIIVAIVVIIIVCVSLYLWRAKKTGVKCIGCPEGNSCSNSCSGSCDGCSGCPSGCSTVGKYYNK